MDIKKILPPFKDPVGDNLTNAMIDQGIFEPLYQMKKDFGTIPRIVKAQGYGNVYVHVDMVFGSIVKSILKSIPETKDWTHRQFEDWRKLVNVAFLKMEGKMYTSAGAD